jgi:phenylpropionate dioxygenase-like ring-hydroxylating dioxygenase large terminal subunit
MPSPRSSISRIKAFRKKGASIGDSAGDSLMSEVESSASSSHDADDAGFSAASSTTSVDTIHTPALNSSLPSSWYTSENFYALEARAIFAQVRNDVTVLIMQSWHCITHSSRFQTPGTYYKVNVATYPIFLILSKDGIIRGFHNVCRHRGFPVVSKDTGCSTVIGCRYHGWSYNSKGELIKVLFQLSDIHNEAPSFDPVDEFEKKGNSLFPVHVHVTEKGLIFVNLSADENVIPFEASPIHKLRLTRRNTTKTSQRSWQALTLSTTNCSPPRS